MEKLPRRDSKLAVTFGRELREARRRLSLSQEEVAEALGTVAEYYCRMERGHCHPSLPMLVRLCRVLGVSSDALLGLGSGASSAPQAEGPSGAPLLLRNLLSALEPLSADQVRLLRELALAMSGRPALPELASEQEGPVEQADELLAMGARRAR